MTLDSYVFGAFTFLFGCVVTGFGYSYAFSNRLTKMESTLTNVCAQVNDLRDGKLTVICPKHEELSSRVKAVENEIHQQHSIPCQ